MKCISFIMDLHPILDIILNCVCCGNSWAYSPMAYASKYLYVTGRPPSHETYYGLLLEVCTYFKPFCINVLFIECQKPKRPNQTTGGA